MRRHRLAIVVAALVMAAAGSLALADQPTMQQHHMGTGAMPTQPGQGAFGAIQEVVRILEADPATDWSKVDTSSAARENRVTTLLVIVDAARDSSSFRVAVTIKNALAQTLAGPDNLRSTQAGLDTALVESGRRLAKRLAQIARR